MELAWSAWSWQRSPTGVVRIWNRLSLPLKEEEFLPPFVAMGVEPGRCSGEEEFLQTARALDLPKRTAT